MEDTEEEVRRYEAAGDAAKKQLQNLYEKALTEVGEASAAIFRVHELMLSDMDFVDSITNMIRTQNVNAEYAAAITGDNFSTLFESMDDDYMRARAADVKDVSERLIRILSGEGQSGIRGNEPVILAAEDLAPSETVQLDKSKILAFYDPVWFGKFPHSDPCADDEYPGSHRRGFSGRLRWKNSGGRWIFRMHLSRPGPGIFENDDGASGRGNKNGSCFRRLREKKISHRAAGR